MKKHLLLFYSVLGLSLSFSFPLLALDVAPRITDREIVERLARLEEGQKSLDKRFNNVNNRFDDMNKRFDNQFSLILWGFGILFTGIFGLIGFIIYDRQHAKSLIQEEIVKITHPQVQTIEIDLNHVKQEIIEIKKQLKLA